MKDIKLFSVLERSETHIFFVGFVETLSLEKKGAVQ